MHAVTAWEQRREGSPRRKCVTSAALCLVLCLVAILALSACTTTARPPVATAQAPALIDGGVLEHEPVFDGTAFIYQAGREHAQTVVLIHGIGDNGMNDWAWLVPKLAERYHVLTFDLPGFARSQKQNQRYSPARYAEFVKWTIDRYAHGPVMMIGHSMGGAVALYYSATYPDDVQRLVLADVAGVLHREVLLKHMTEYKPDALVARWFSPAINGITQSLITATRTRGSEQEIAAILAYPQARTKLLAGDPKRIAGLALVNTNFAPILARVETPTTIIWGEQDRVAPLRTAKVLLYGLPRAELKIIPSGGHVPMTQMPATFNRLALEALASPVVIKPPILAAPKQSGRIGRCMKADDVTFTGYYEEIEIERCDRVQLVNVDTARLYIKGSVVTVRDSRIHARALGLEIRGAQVSLENSDILAEGIAVKAYRSTLIMTAGRISGRIGVHSLGSEMDFAAVEIIGREAAMTTDNGAEALFSISRVRSPHGDVPLHGGRTLKRDRPL